MMKYREYIRLHITATQTFDMSQELIRIYLITEISQNHSLILEGKKHHYITNVMRKRIGDDILIFNEKNGEFMASIIDLSKKHLTLLPQVKLRERKHKIHEITLAFAPVKNDNNSLIVQKTTELGVDYILPIITERTVVRAVNSKKLLDVAIEATEQSNRLEVPKFLITNNLMDVDYSIYDKIIFCDEEYTSGNLSAFCIEDTRKILIIIGPEGGFTSAERSFLKTIPNLFCVSLGPNKLRAETASITVVSVLMMLANKNI